MLYGAIEAGGTKFVCAVGNEKGELLEKAIIDTTTPEKTLEQIKTFYLGKDIVACGVGSFGPIDVNKESPTYGYIMNTPKIKWQKFNLLGELKKLLGVPLAFDSDVNVAAVGEKLLGAGRDVNSCLYMTIGTGIGAGLYVEGSTLSGLSHPEMGHILLKRHPEDSDFTGFCPFHGADCFEGLAAGPAIEKRWDKKGNELGVDHEAWRLEAYYIAQALMNYILIVSPEKIVLGGGVMKQKQLFPLIFDELIEKLNGYLDFPQLTRENISRYIVSPELGDEAGVKGALMTAVKML
ncbi:fructokinase [Salirhabdus euzebyi]|uniref:fructokinase n=1 Tax=Salirhabdus euzebyi TaxID=394506 RepID=A0A841Q5J2_9BACI|nr:ROK family protein [Salirhabdus euzebyi]MBB6453654.1 fructokinase [Salirhabdus euzebyi]